MYKDDEGAFLSVTYKDFTSDSELLAAGLSALGVKRSDNVGLISDNRKEWLLADTAILSLGANSSSFLPIWAMVSFLFLPQLFFCLCDIAWLFMWLPSGYCMA